jgi:prepilin-type processing-associated H-X9-DG protein
MHQYGLAFHNHADVFQGVLPVGAARANTRTVSKGTVQQCTWVTFVWPYIELAPLAELYSHTTSSIDVANQPAVSATPQIYYCPSAKRQSNNHLWAVVGLNELRARGSYVVCVGHGTRNRGGNDTGFPYYQIVHPTDGSKWRGSMFTYSVEMALSDIKDGLSNTMALSEAYLSDRGDQRTWRGDFLNDSGFPYYSTYQHTPNSTTGDWMRTTTSYNTSSDCSATANAPCTNNIGSAHDDCQAARSYHTGGVNVAMGDGSVTFINNNIAWKEWGILGSAWSQGKSPVPTAYQ